MTLFKSARLLLWPARILSVCAVLALIAQASQIRLLSVSASQQPSALPLVPGAPLERQLSGGQTHFYQLGIPTEACVKIAVEQRGVDVALTLVDQSGKPLREEDRLSSRGTEWLLWVSPGPGSYQLAIRARELAATGTYQVLFELFPAEESCRQAFEAYSEGRRLVRQGRGAYQEALRNFEEALPYWRTRADRELTAVTLHQLGFLNEKLKNAAVAFDDYQQALTLFRQLGSNTEAALVLNDLSAGYSNQGSYTKALENSTAGLVLVDALSPADAADLMFDHGVALQNLSKHQDALEFFQRALTAYRALGDKQTELQALSEVGRTYYAAGEMVRSLEYTNQGLALSRAYKIPLLEARFAQDVGRIFQYLEDYEKARDYCEQALRLFRAEKYVNGEIATLLLLGEAQYNLNDNAAAQESYETATTLARAAKFTEAEARAAVRLGTVLSEKGEFALALEYRQRALAFYRATGNHRSEASALLLLGKTYHQMGNAQEAIAVLQQGLQVSREAVGGFGETQLLGELALVARDGGRLEEAEQKLTALLSKFDAERRSLLAPSLSATFGNGAQSWYGIYADLLMRLHELHPEAGYDRRAWQAAEHAKAWGLLEMLAEARTDLHEGLDPALLDKRRRLWEELSRRAAASEASAGRAASGAQADEVTGGINDLTTQLQLVETQLRAASPRYVALVQPEPLTTAALQQQLLDDHTVLLEFALGDDESWLWAVTRDGFDSYKLAPRAQLDAAARHMYGLLVARQPKPGVLSSQRRTIIANADASLPSAAADVSRLLLGAIESRLRQEWRDKRLVIVASGALEYLPFDALRLPGGPVLLVEHEVVNLPSASVLARLRDESAGRRPAKRTLALFADPVFDRGDPRVSRAAQQRLPDGESSVAQIAKEGEAAATSTGDAALRRAVGSFTRAGFARLLFSHEEAVSIAEMVPKGSLLEATGFQANHALAVSGELSQYRFVHFATHGLLNSQHPELSGLVLSLVNQTGQAQNGFLRLQEIFNLQLPADVVVLSACQTALGKEMKGEGLVGLTRGFMYAGAQRVVASLWEVDDLATAELMKAFYRGMLKDGLRPAAALRSAQLEMMKQPRWASPYYWSAFTLQGEWR